MRLETIRRMSMLPFGLSVLLLLEISPRSPAPGATASGRPATRANGGAGSAGQAS